MMRLPSLSAALLGALAWTASAAEPDGNIKSISVCFLICVADMDSC